MNREVMVIEGEGLNAIRNLRFDHFESLVIGLKEVTNEKCVKRSHGGV